MLPDHQLDPSHLWLLPHQGGCNVSCHVSFRGVLPKSPARLGCSWPSRMTTRHTTSNLQASNAKNSVSRQGWLTLIYLLDENSRSSIFWPHDYLLESTCRSCDIMDSHLDGHAQIDGNSKEGSQRVGRTWENPFPSVSAETCNHSLQPGYIMKNPDVGATNGPTLWIQKESSDQREWADCI